MYAAAPMDQQLDEPDLRSYLGVIARRRWLVILTTLVFVGVAVAVSLIPEPTYRVRAQVLTTGANDPVAMIFRANANTDLERQASSQLAFLSSSKMRLAVARAYDGSLSDGDVFRVSANQVGAADSNRTSSVVEISLVSTDPEAAATLVNTYAETYVTMRETAAQVRLLRSRQRLQGLLSEVEADIAAAMRPVDDIDAQIAEGAGDDAALIAQRQSELERLRPTLEPL